MTWKWVLAAGVVRSEIYDGSTAGRPTGWIWRQAPEKMLLRSFAVNRRSGKSRWRLGGTCGFLIFFFFFKM